MIARIVARFRRPKNLVPTARYVDDVMTGREAEYHRSNQFGR